MHLAHHPLFVALSVLTACLGAWTALDLFRRMQAHAGTWRRMWAAAAGAAMGLSIWSMHFIAILGFDPGAPVRYDVSLTIWSLVLAIAATTFAFVWARPTPLRQLGSGVVMGAGICGMHYMGMAALITSAQIFNEKLFVALAFLVAVFASSGALMVAMRETTWPQRILAAIALGFAVVGMHYVGMLGVDVIHNLGVYVPAPGIEPHVLAIGVAGGTLYILLLAFIATLADRRFQALEVREAMRSGNQLRAILENLPFGIIVASAPDGSICFANAEAIRLLDRPLSGPPIWDADGGVIDAQGRRVPLEEHVLYQAIQTQQRVGPKIQRYRRPNGEIILVEATVSPIPDRDSRDATLWVSAFQDVTARVAAEEQARETARLRVSEERFRFIAEQAPVMLWMVGANGNVFINREMRETGGFSEAEAGPGWRMSLIEEDRGRVLEAFERGMKQHESFSLEATFRTKEGQLRILQVLGRPQFNEDGEFLGLMGANTDITEARAAQRKQQEINELLEQRASAALAEKAEAEAALMHAQRLESLGRLTGGVAHDFNNLLTVVIGALDVILRPTTTAERRTRLGEAALSAARRGERLTAQLLAFARRQPLQPEMCDLNDLIRECAPLLRRATGDSVTLTLQLADDRAIALIDPTQFEACLLNLVVNAVDATAAGGEVGIDTAIDTLPAGERCVRVTVWDRGHGMSTDVIYHIFEPFYTTKAPGKGTGLGLSQVYGFVKQSGGEVKVESTPGAGTRMSVFLPLENAPAESSPPKPSVLPAVSDRLNILLAEDDPAVAGITQTMLGELGHNVMCATNAEQALQVLRSDAPLDVLLTDVIMPGGMNGVELAHEAVRIRRGLGVLLCSGYAGEKLDESIARGDWPLLRKPYLQSELAEALARLVSETRMAELTHHAGA